MVVTPFARLFAIFDAATATFANDVSGRVISAAMPAVILGVWFYVLLTGFACLRGAGNTSATDLLWRWLRIGIIVGVAGSSGWYQANIADMIQHMPDEFANSILPAGVNGGAAANVIDNAASLGLTKAGDAFEKSGIFSQQAIAYSIYALLLLLATVFLCVICGFFIILAKIGLAILAAVGPLFIFALLWRATAGFFERWLAQVMGFAMLILAVSAVSGLVLQTFSTYMNNVNFESGESFAGTLGGALILTGLFGLVVIQVAHFAQGLGGGSAVGLFHEARIASGIGQSVSNATGATQAARSGLAAGGAIRSAAGGAAMRGGAAAGQAMSHAVGRAVGRFRAR